MKSFSSIARLDHPAANVVEQIATTDFVVFSYAQTDGLDAEVLRDDDETFHYRVVRNTEPTALPRLLRRAMGRQIRIIQDHVWQRVGPPFEGQLTIRVAGVDGSIVAGLQMVESGAKQCEYRAQGRISVPIPFIGGEMERFLAERASSQFEHGVESIRAWLKQRRP